MVALQLLIFASSISTTIAVGPPPPPPPPPPGVPPGYSIPTPVVPSFVPIPAPTSIAPPDSSQQDGIQNALYILDTGSAVLNSPDDFASSLIQALEPSKPGSPINTIRPTSAPPALVFDDFLYAPCLAYLQTLTSCNGEVSGFYTIFDRNAQASCACYTAAYSPYGQCATSTFTTGFDNVASGCRNFVLEMGLTHLATAMTFTALIPGPSLCAGAQAAASRAGSSLPSSKGCSGSVPQNTGLYGGGAASVASSKSTVSKAVSCICVSRCAL